MTKFLIKRKSELTKENSIFRLEGILGSAPANAVTNIDWKMPEERWITGGMLIVKNGHWGDKISLYVVYKDEMGNETIVNQFVKNYLVTDDKQFQCSIDVDYVSLVLKDLFLRISYINTHGTEQTEVGLNLFSHIPYDIAFPSS